MTWVLFDPIIKIEETNHEPENQQRPRKLFSKDLAEKTAAEMNAGDEDWTYTVIVDPKSTAGWAFVEITDEDGEFVAYL